MDARQKEIVAAFAPVGEKDREYARDMMDDLGRVFDDCDLGVIAEWFRKARCEAVLEWTAKAK